MSFTATYCSKVPVDWQYTGVEAGRAVQNLPDHMGCRVHTRAREQRRSSKLGKHLAYARTRSKSSTMPAKNVTLANEFVQLYALGIMSEQVREKEARYAAVKSQKDMDMKQAAAAVADHCAALRLE